VPLSHNFTKQGPLGIFGNERTRSTPLDPKLMFWGVSNHFVTARKSMQNWPNWCHYRTSSLKKVSSEFFATNAPDPLHWTQNSCFGTFRNERTRSTLMDPKLIFRGISDRFINAQKSMQNRPNWYHYRTSSPHNVASEFFATNAPDALHLSQNSCFRGISDHFITARKLMQNLPN
jgi:hypothetical protein